MKPEVTSNPGLKILLVDDESMMRELVKVTLETTNGWEIATAADGHEGLRLIKEGDFDLILLDVVMPNFNGLQVLEALQLESDITSRIPVILFTASIGSQNKRRYAMHNATWLISKPFDPMSLGTQINNAYNVFRLQKTSVGANTSYFLEQAKWIDHSFNIINNAINNKQGYYSNGVPILDQVEVCRAQAEAFNLTRQTRAMAMTSIFYPLADVERILSSYPKATSRMSYQRAVAICADIRLRLDEVFKVAGRG